MNKVWHKIPRLRSAHWLLAASTCILLGLLVTGCGSSSASADASQAKAASATPTCPPIVQTKSITGAVHSISSASFTVATSTGTTETVHLGSTTRYTEQVTGTTANLTTGETVEVTTDSSGVTALRVIVVGTASSSSGTGGTGGTGGFGGFGGRRGTPVAGSGNSSCFRRDATAEAGSGFGGFGGGSGSGSFSGIRGTLTTVTVAQLVVSDTSGTSYTLAITPSTVITSLSSAKASDLAVGDSVIAEGSSTSDGITARSVIIESASTSNS